jgi:hypothetical protein
MTDKRERDEFDKWLALPVAAGDDPAPWVDSLACDAAWQAWQARAALAAHDAGWVLVPKEPTSEQLAAAQKDWNRKTFQTPMTTAFRDLYLAMLAAAPSKQEQPK